jgi:prephenate dehydratase
MKLGLSGLKGSFSEEAALLYAKKEGLTVEPIYCLDMAGVLKALKEGSIETGIFPVVNSIGGLVETAFEAMGQYNFKMTDKLPFEVNQCVLVLPGTKREDIKQVTSHPQALAQCKNYLAREFPNAHLVNWSDTASAARDLADGTLPKNTAVLASPQAADYGLEVMESSVHDQNPNLTTFIIVKPLAND